MLINLIFNAIQALPDKGGEVRVSVRLLDEIRVAAVPNLEGSVSDWVEIVIRDTGTGIPEDIRGRIFEPFVSSKTSGTGLGLAIVARLAENAKGHIHLETSNNRGTAFSLILPRCRARRAHAPDGVAATSGTRAPAV
jgi:two-component system nitrogen regulation sensor histidine kinase GlnL